MPELFAAYLYFFTLSCPITPDLQWHTRAECKSYVSAELAEFKKKHPSAIAIGLCIRVK
jgi:hypothetical protein